MQASRALDAVHEETIGRALELEAVDELLDSFDRRVTGELRINMREMSNQSTPLSAVKNRQAICGITSALQSVFKVTQRVGYAKLHADDQKVVEEPTEAFFLSKRPAKSQEKMKNFKTDNAKSSEPKMVSLYQVHIAYNIYKRALQSFRCCCVEDEFFLRPSTLGTAS